MARLYDKIMAEPFAFQADTQPSRKAIAGAPVIAIDNVGEYYYAISDQEHWTPEDFPNVAPPFQRFWMEFKRPSRILSREYGTTPTDLMPEFTGALFTVVTPEDLWPEEAAKAKREKDILEHNKMVIAAHFSASPLLPGLDYALPYDRMSPETSASMRHLATQTETVLRWSVRAMTFYLFNGELLGPVEMFRILVGNPITARPLSAMQASAPEGLPRVSAQVLEPFMLGLSFLNCRNVTTTENVPPEKWAGSVSAALHIVAGHFKHYEEGHGLFGRWHGTYWFGDTVRGTAAAGRADKEYSVSPPRDKKAAGKGSAP